MGMVGKAMTAAVVLAMAVLRRRWQWWWGQYSDGDDGGADGYGDDGGAVEKAMGAAVMAMEAEMEAAVDTSVVSLAG